MSPAALAATMAALGGSRAVAPAAALPATPATLAPPLAAALPAPDASTIAPAPASSGLSCSVLNPAAQVQQQAGAVPWEQIAAECGFDRAGPQAAVPQPCASDTRDGAFDWGELIAEAGLGHEAQPAADSFTDDGWAALAAEAAAERRTKHQD